MASDLQTKLNGLWAASVVSQRFDLLSKAILFDLKIVEFGKMTERQIIFHGVASFYFVNNIGKKRFDIAVPDQGDYMEFTSIRYCKNGIGKIDIDSIEPWTKQWHSSANFVIELWSSILFIEAESVIIDGKVFDVEHSQVEKTDLNVL